MPDRAVRTVDEWAGRIAELVTPLRVRPGPEVDLAEDFDLGYTAGITHERVGQELLRTGKKPGDEEPAGATAAP
ncbi:hypothetical protein [Streptomyces sp. NPDC017529]|uniref:hypothetical protein n=1 Tax=Streptomyces sp. NPDC017529 TaxID=3365000 RepID=UPI003791F188